MSGFFLNKPTLEEIDYDGIFNGKNLTIPDGAILNSAVTGGFLGQHADSALMICEVNIVITSKGEFFGQKYKFKAKMFDKDKDKRDEAMKNLGVLDAQAGFPLTNGELEITTDNIEKYWVGKAEARVEFGLLISSEDMKGNPHLDSEGNPTTKDINWITGFGYLREKMIKAGGDPIVQSEPVQETKPELKEPKFDDNEEDIDF